MEALSVDLPHPRHPFTCQGCGAVYPPVLETEAELLDHYYPPPGKKRGKRFLAKKIVVRWQECDERDRRSPVVVVLCPACSSRLIEPHPRLYYLLRANEPFPGTMPICADCPRRDGLTCTSPEEVRLTQKKSRLVHLYYGGGKGGYVREWPEPVVDCSGKPSELLPRPAPA